MIKYNDFKCTLAECSKDSSHVDENGNIIEMITSSKIAVNFDKFLENYFKNVSSKSRPPESVDALCILGGRWCLIEFKNGDFKRSEICSKIGNSVSTVLFKENIEPSQFKNNSMFILVYNREAKNISEENYRNLHEEKYLKSNKVNPSKSMNDISDFFGKISGEPIVLFGLNTFKHIYFSQVITMDKNVFDEFIQTEEVLIPNN